MRYENIVPGIFRNRPNRFVAEIEVNGNVEKCHVKNTGRCREILYSGAEVFLQDSQGISVSGTIKQNEAPKMIRSKRQTERTLQRKTRYDVIAVRKGDQIVNIDSQIPNKAVLEWIKAGNLFSGDAILKPEQRFGQSRFDLYIEDGDRKAFMEIKGVTLEEGGIARFPDAPTERGVKHVMELCECRKAGYDAYLFFLIQMKGVSQLQTNWKTHEAFGQAMQEAQKAGVKILAYDSIVTEDSIAVGNPVAVVLKDTREATE